MEIPTLLFQKAHAFSGTATALQEERQQFTKVANPEIFFQPLRRFSGLPQNMGPNK